MCDISSCLVSSHKLKFTSVLNAATVLLVPTVQMRSQKTSIKTLFSK